MVDQLLVTRLRDVAAAVLPGTPVCFSYLFGSVATGRARSGSDLDVAVYLVPSVRPERYLETNLDLARRLERAVRAGEVDLLVLNDAPLPVLGRVLRDRLVLYSRDESLRVRFESRTLRQFMDFDIHARELDRQLLRAMAEGRR